MLSCKEISYLASKKLDSQLTLRESVNFSLHTAMCGLCRRYTKDIKTLHTMMLKIGKAGKIVLPESVKLSKQSRDRIKKVIDKALEKN